MQPTGKVGQRLANILHQLQLKYNCMFLIVSFSHDVCVMILVRTLSKIIIGTSYLKLAINSHKLHYKYYLLGSTVYVLPNDEATKAHNMETADLDF